LLAMAHLLVLMLILKSNTLLNFLNLLQKYIFY
jgi:hypothetical protein